MKKTLLKIVVVLMAALPPAASAQSNIQSAFDAIIKCKEATITESHSLTKDPQTNTKTGQSDVYNFVLPADKMNLIKDVLSAFKKDSEKAYGIETGNTSANSKRKITSLAVGNDSGSGVKVNDEEGNYQYATFLAPKSEDPEGIYRYAYAINYLEKGNKIRGKLIITYAQTLMYRQQKEKENRYKTFRNFTGSNIEITTTESADQSWFATLMTYFRSMSQANTQTRIALATKAYKVIQNYQHYSDVTDADKNTVREILKRMIADENYSEPILNQLLNQCLVNLK